MRASVINQQAQAQAQAHSVWLQLAVLADSGGASHSQPCPLIVDPMSDREMHQ
jgi:hypothetical protein